MAIYTPTGLKIRISLESSFGLMTRLFPKITPFKFLKSVEGLELLPPTFAFIAGFVCFILQREPITIGLSTLVAYLIGILFSSAGIIDKIILFPGIFYSYFSGYGVFIVVSVIIGYFCSGIKGLFAYFFAKLIGFLIAGLFDMLYQDYAQKKYGYPFTGAERSFFNIYKFYAYKLNANPSLKLTNKELKEESWGVAYKHLAINWPEVVNRFTKNG